MYTYKISFVFDNSKGVNYPIYPVEFESARIQFNENSRKRRNGREIEEIELLNDEFLVTLNSTNNLDKPSKSLVKFSQFLIETGKFDDYVKNKHLLRSKWSENISYSNTLSDAEFLNILICWIIDEDKNDSALTKDRKIKTIKEMKKLVLNAGVIIK